MPKKRKQKISFKIRGLKAGDARDMLSNYYKRYNEAYRNPSLGLGLQKKKPSIQEESEFVKDLIKRVRKEGAIAYVAEANGRVVGVCKVLPTIRGNIETDHVGILGITVEEGYRANGIGTALLENAIKSSKSRYKIITLNVLSANKQAIRLYSRFGFKTYGKLPGGFIRSNRSFDELLMYLKL